MSRPMIAGASAEKLAVPTGLRVSQSDYPLLESAVFALIENFVLAVLIAWASLWRTSRKKVTRKGAT